MKLLDKVISSLVTTLIQSVIVLSIASYVLLDYIDTKMEQTQTIKVLSISDIVTELQGKNFDNADITKYVDALISVYEKNGVIVIDSSSILSAPKSVYDKLPKYTELVKD